MYLKFLNNFWNVFKQILLAIILFIAIIVNKIKYLQICERFYMIHLQKMQSIQGKLSLKFMNRFMFCTTYISRQKVDYILEQFRF